LGVNAIITKISKPFKQLKMSTPKTLPMTVQCPLTSNLGARVVIGPKQYSVPYDKTNLYWLMVVDRVTLDVKVNITFSDNHDVPSQIAPYQGDSRYLLVLTTSLINSANIPTGAFYDYLVGEGAGPQLNRMEQIYETLNCGNWGWFAYTYVAIMGDDSTDGFEEFSFTNSTIMTLSLMPIKVGGDYYYTPIRS
jgi:hypothetical protein